MKTKTLLSLRAIAMVLQDAYWYARRAVGHDDGLFHVTRTEALKLAWRNYQEAVGSMEGWGFRRPRKLADAAGLLSQIEAFALAHAIDASQGETFEALAAEKAVQDARQIARREAAKEEGANQMVVPLQNRCEACGRDVGEGTWCDSGCFNAAFNQKHYGSSNS